MQIYSGRYSWDGKKHCDREPIAWFPGAYTVKIFDLSQRNQGVRHLKPYLCVYANTGKGHSISAHPERFVQRLCNDFSLELDKVIWTEDLRQETDRFEIITFRQNGKLGDQPFYQIQKRKPLEGEAQIIANELTATG